MLRFTLRHIRVKVAVVCAVSALATLVALGSIAPQAAQAAQPAWYEDNIAFVDMPVANNDQGLVQANNLEIFGPAQQTSFGDPYTSLWDNPSVPPPSVPNPYYPELTGAYTYRIAIPPDYPYNKIRIELLDPQTGNTATLPTKIWQTTGASTTGGITCTSQTNPCLISTSIGSATDPSNPFWFVRMDENRNTGTSPSGYTTSLNTRTLFRLYYQRRLSNGVMQPVDLAYYIGKKDDASQARPVQGTWTSAQTAAQSQTEALATMLQWVSPGAPAAERMPAFNATDASHPAPMANSVNVLYNTPAEPATVTEDCTAIDNANGTGQALRLPLTTPNPQAGGTTPVAPANTPCAGNGDFVVDLNNETSDIYTDPLTGIRYLSLDVIGMDGASENNFHIWAGPARSDFTPNANGYTFDDAPADVNARQLYVIRERNAATTVHAGGGAKVYGAGHLPLNMLTSARTRFPLAYIGPELAGKFIHIQLFDADSGTLPPIIFYMDNIPQDLWQACFTEGSYNCATDMGGPTGGALGSSQLGMNDTWVNYQFQLPSASAPTNFHGGTLMVYYQGGMSDTFQFKLAWTDPLPGTLQLNSPADGAGSNGTPAYSWLALAGATMYQFEYDDNADFSSPIWISDITNQLSITPPTQAPGAYYWRARARDALHAWAPWSAARTIHIGQVDPVPPDLTIHSLSVAGVPPNPAADTDITIQVSVDNVGGTAVPADSTVKVYGVQGAPLPMPVTPASLSGATLLGSATLPAGLAAGATSSPLTVTTQLGGGGQWYLYAFADADLAIDEAGVGLTTYDPARENNNISDPSVLTVTAEADLALQVTVDNPTPASGQNVVLSVKLTNLGGSTASNIDLTDVLPAGLTFVSSTPSTGLYNSGSGHWTIATLAKNQTATLNITAKVTAATGTTITDQVTGLTMGSGRTDPNHTNDLSCTDGCRQATMYVGALNLAISKTTSLPNPAEGSANPFTYTLSVTNLSLATGATNVTITDPLPTTLTFVSASSGCANSSGTVTCSIGSLSAGGTSTSTITVYAKTGTAGMTVSNTASVTANEPDPDQTNNSSSVNVLVQSVDIAITKTVSPIYALENATFTWTVTATNNGPSVANNVTVLDNVPTTVLNAVTYTPAAEFNTTTHIWTVGTLAVGQTKTLTITTSARTGQNNHTISNTASFVSADKTDVNSANNSATSTVLIQNGANADLSLVKTASPTTVTPGASLAYTFTATNNGPMSATTVVMTDTTLKNAIASGFFTCTANCATTSSATKFNTTNGQWSIGSLAAGANATLQVTLTYVGDGTTSSFFNSASITGIPADQDPSNNTSSVTLALDNSGTPYPNVSATNHDFGVVKVGTSSGPFTFTITNTGSPALTLGSLSPVGSAAFKLTNDTCSGHSLNNLQTCTFDISFKPAVTGAHAGTITLSSNSSFPAPVITLSGSGTLSAMSLSATSHAFGSVSVGSSSGPFTFTVTNTGSVSLGIGALSKSGDAGFTLGADTCSNASVAAGATCSFDVTFTPTSSGPVSGSISIPDDAPGNPHSVTFSGTGLQSTASLSVTSHPFGNVLVGASSTPFGVTITNTGNMALHIGTLARTGSGEFALSADTCSGATVAVGGTCTFSVTFSPTAVGAVSGSITIPDDAPNTPQSVSLTGTGVQPAASLSAASHSFGIVIVGSSAGPFMFALGNTGSAPMHVGTLSQSGSSDFILMGDNCSGATLAPNSACSFQVKFSPTAPGAASGSISIPDDTPTTPESVTFDGTGTQSAASLSAASHSFGSAPVGGSAGPFTFTLTSTGSAPLHIGTLSKSGSGSFALSADTCSGATVAVGSTCTFDVTFAPTAAGAVSGSITIPDDAPDTPQSVSFNGTGLQPAVSLSAASHSFGSVLAGSSAGPFTFTLTNSGDFALHIGALGQTGSDTFALSADTCSGATVAVGDTCSFAVTFNPAAAGAVSGAISIPDDAADTPQGVTFDGTGTRPGASLSAASHSFGEVLSGGSSGPFTFTLTSSGGAPLHIGALSQTGSDAFALSADTCSGAALAPGGTCTFDVTFNPAALGAVSGSISIPDDAPDTPQSVSFDGTGVQPAASLSAASHDFGPVLVGGSGGPFTFTLTNSGSGTLHVGTLGKTGSADYALSADTCSGAAVAAGGNCTFAVTFSPSATGAASGSISIPDDALDTPQGVAVSGTGIRPAVSLSAASHNFGTVSVAASSLPYTFTLTNSGSAPLHIGTLSRTGSTDYALSADTCSGATVAAGSTCTFAVTFSPTVQGAISGTVSIPSDAPGSPHSVSLSGNGVVIPPDLTIVPGSFTVAGVPPNPTSNTDVTLHLSVRNIGSTPTPVDSTVRIFGTKGAPLPTPVTAASLASATVLGADVIVPAGFGAGQTLPITATIQFPSSGVWYLYAFADADNVIDEAGIGLIVYDPTREDNNISAPLPITVTPPPVALSVTSHNFGSVAVGSASAPFTFTATNHGSAAVTLSALSKLGSASYAISADTCSGQTMSSGGSCTFDVTFSPSAAGPAFGSVRVSYDLPGGPASASFSGTGIQPAVSLSAPSHAFGNVLVGGSAGPFTFTLTNSGDAALHVDTLAKSGSGAFALSGDTCSGATVAAGNTCSFDVTFTPAAAGAVSGSVSIPSDAPGSPHSVTFSGTGTQPGITLSTASHDFGSQNVNSTSAPFTITVTSSGGAPLTIGSVTPSGEFDVANNTCSAPINPGGTCALDLTFSPTSGGAKTGSISIVSDAPASPTTIALSGTGVPPGAPPAPVSPMNGAAISTHTPKLTWKAQTGVSGYHILLQNLVSLGVVSDQDVTTPSFTTPQLDFGSYGWQVKSNYPPGWSIYSLQRTFDVTISKKPGRDEAVGTHFPTFSWQKLKGATRYQLEVYTSADDCKNGVTASALVTKQTAGASYHLAAPDPSLPFGQYYWREAASQGVTTPFMPCWPFSVTTLKTPKPGSALTGLLPKFSWLANKAASGYQINVYRVAPDGSSSLFFSRTTTKPAYPSTAADGFTYGRYQWTVQEDIGGLGAETPAFSFDLTIMSKPAGKSFLLDTTPAFSWKKIKSQTGYTLQIADDAGFTSIVRSYDLGNVAAFTLPDADALPQGVYFWRIVTAPGGLTMPGWSITIGP